MKDYSKEYGVRKAENLSDNGVMYGQMSTGAMWTVGILGFLAIPAIFVLFTTFYYNFGV